MNKVYTKNSRVKADNITNRIIIHLLINTSFNLLVCAVLCLVMFMAGSNIDSNYFMILTLLCFSVFVSGYYSGRKFRKNGIVIGIIYNLPFILILVITALAINTFLFDSRLIITLVSLLLFSALGGIVSVNTRKKQKR